MGMGRMPEVSMSSPNMKQCWIVGDIWSEHGGGKGSISSMHFPSEIVSVCHRHAESLNETDKWMWQRLKVKPACNDWAIFSFLLKKAAVLRKAAPLTARETHLFCSRVPAFSTSEPPLGSSEGNLEQPFLWAWGF